jgi:signal transduction histidine kinase
MMPPVLSKEVVNFLLKSGWQQFWLNEQYHLQPPTNALANLGNCDPPTLTNYLLTQLFVPVDAEKLHSLLTQLTTEPERPMPSCVLTLQTDLRTVVTELILYPAAKDAPGTYTGFIRPLPTPNSTQKNKIEAAALLGQSIADSTTVDPLLAGVVKQLSQNFGYQHTALLLTNPTETMLVLRAISGIELNAISPEALNIPINRHTVAGQAAQSAKPLLVNSEALSVYQPVGYLPNQVQCELAVPLVTKGQVLGVINIQSPQPNHYHPDDLAFLTIIASQLAVAIENIRLSEERDRRMAAELIAFNQLGTPVAQQNDLPEIFANIVKQIETLFKVEAVSLLLLENNQLRFAASTDSKSEQIKSFVLSVGQGIAWSAIAAQKPIQVEDAKADKRHFGDIDVALNFTTRSLLAVPIKTQDRILGVVEAINRLDGHPFTREDEATLEFIVSSVAVVIENARLFGEIQQQIERVEKRAVELEHAIKEVEAANRLTTEFVENVSHELRTPLTFIKAYMALILENELGEIPQTVREKLEIVLQKTETIIRLVEDLVTLQKIEAKTLKLNPVSVNNLMTRITQWATASAAEHNIEIVQNCAPALPDIQADAGRLGQVFDNLVGNALKFSPPGSKIYITAEQDQQQIKFSVKDTGVGIPPDKVNKIFERFYQVKRDTTFKYSGAGLGLTIVKQIVEAHHGRITVASEPDKGTTFSFWLPIDSDTRPKKT